MRARERTWMRAAAFGIDLLLFAGTPLLVTTAAVFGILLASADPPLYLATLFRGAQLLFVFLFLTRDARGASPGKRLFGFRVVRIRGGPSGALDSLVRNLPLLVPGWNLVEALSVLTRPDGRRPGDRAAGTAVVEE